MFTQNVFALFLASCLIAVNAQRTFELSVFVFLKIVFDANQDKIIYRFLNSSMLYTRRNGGRMCFVVQLSESASTF